MIIPVGFCQANFKFTGVAVPLGAEVTQGFEISGFVGPSPDAVADVLADAWSTNIMPTLSTEITFSECAVKFGPNDTGAAGSVTRAVTGSVPATAVPPNTSLLVRKVTGLGGRRGRGRLYLPGIDEARVSPSGTISAVNLGFWQVAFDGFDEDCRAAFLLPVVLHAAGNTATPAPTEQTRYSVQTTVATQRDRLRR